MKQKRKKETAIKVKHIFFILFFFFLSYRSNFYLSVCLVTSLDTNLHLLSDTGRRKQERRKTNVAERLSDQHLKNNSTKKERRKGTENRKREKGPESKKY